MSTSEGIWYHGLVIKTRHAVARFSPLAGNRRRREEFLSALGSIDRSKGEHMAETDKLSRGNGDAIVLFIVSRYLPEKHFGSGAYVSDFLTYLKSSGIDIHFILLDDGDWFKLSKKFPVALADVDIISYNNYHRYRSHLIRVPAWNELVPFLLKLICTPPRLLYGKLPEKYKKVYRKFLKRQTADAAALRADPAGKKPAS